MNKQWHVWTVIPNRYNKIKEFLSSLLEIKDFIYPTAEKEYNTKLGKQVKNVPLYSNYIFLQYDHNNYTDQVIEVCPWMCNYIGKCSLEEINRVKISDKQRYEDLILDGDLYVGKQVKMIKTPFKDMLSRVVEIDGEKLVVSITLFGDERLVKCSANDVDIGD